MRFRLIGILPALMATAIAIVSLNGAAYGQFTQVEVNVPLPSVVPAPVETPFMVSATVDPAPQKVEFYRNNVLQGTDSQSPFELPNQGPFGQDTYTYRVRAYDSNGNYMDSPDVKLTVETPRFFKLGTNGTSGPNRNEDHTDDVQAAINYLSTPGPNGETGGTIYFPCWPTPNLPSPPYDPGIPDRAIYNIKNSLPIPSNITLQGESSEDEGKCQIWYWDTSAPYPDQCNASPESLTGKAMFRIAGGTQRVRFKDLALRGMTAGPNCYPRFNFEGQVEQIAGDNNAAIHLDTQNDGDISDVIFENVTITHFTHGIRATSCVNHFLTQVCEGDSGRKIFDIKFRGYRAQANHRQLYINSATAHDWDVQNLNINSMAGPEGRMETGQGGVEIVNAGKPAGYSGDRGDLRFLQLNCNGNPERNPGPCVQVWKHGGLYFKQLHYESTPMAISVEDISSDPPRTNPDPIVFEQSVMSGEFKDPSMKLYLVGNHLFAAPETAAENLDAGRMKFVDLGKDSTVVDCGDVHSDLTDTHFGEDQNNPIEDDVTWDDLRMLWTHTERNRSSFFLPVGGVTYNMRHKTCPADSPNMKDVGGKHFNTGVMPTEAFLPYSHVLTSCAPTFCAGVIQSALSQGGTLYIGGPITLKSTVTVPSGAQILGNGSQITFAPTSLASSAFYVNAPLGLPGLPRTSSVVMRNLKLKTTLPGKSGIAIVGETAIVNGQTVVGNLSDMHVSGLTVEGFDKGLDAGAGDPMMDGVSLKNMTFVNNRTAAMLTSGNTSNWNVMDLKMDSNLPGDRGWHQIKGGNSIQDVRCRGTSGANMEDCIKLERIGSYITGLRRTEYVNNAVNVGEGGFINAGDPIYEGFHFSHLILRNSDLRPAAGSMDESARMTILGKTFLTSMNNRYGYFSLPNNDMDGQESRVTECGDTFTSGVTPYLGLQPTFPNRWVGLPTPTRIQCGSDPIAWEDTVHWGGNSGDIPLVGNFYDATREDFVIYRPGAPGLFHIQRADQPQAAYIDLGQAGAIPLIGEFYPGENSQVAVWVPSSGEWWAKRAPQNTVAFVTSWGNGPIHHDKPFVGNFINESAPPQPWESPAPAGGGDEDEIAVYRPGDGYLYIMNPRNSRVAYIDTNIEDASVQIQVADFLGKNYDQIGLFLNGTWNVFDARDPASVYGPLSFGAAGDVPVAGMYLPEPGNGFNPCAQLGYWHPTTQEFVIKDSGFGNCPSRGPETMVWGSNNDLFGPLSCRDNSNPPVPIDCVDDIPLTINGAEEAPLLRRPVSYRPTKGVFRWSVANGEWWIHDLFPQ